MATMKGRRLPVSDDKPTMPPATEQPEPPYAAWARQQRRIEASIARAYESDDPGSPRQPLWERTANGEKV